jgi:hypothetical protein
METLVFTKVGCLKIMHLKTLRLNQTFGIRHFTFCKLCQRSAILFLQEMIPVRLSS